LRPTSLRDTLITYFYSPVTLALAPFRGLAMIFEICYNINKDPSSVEGPSVIPDGARIRASILGVPVVIYQCTIVRTLFLATHAATGLVGLEDTGYLWPTLAFGPTS
jgi:hypothetical protein